MSRGLVMSDLHLFSPRSRATDLLRGVEGRLADADTWVLNGDTFDFRWSVLSNRDATIAAALNWLQQQMDQRPYQKIHYILGNHDCITGFTEELHKLAKLRPSLVCHDYFLKLGGCMFLHGDCANRRMDANALRKFRESWSSHTQSGRLRKMIYQAADSTGVSDKVHEWWFPQVETVLRVAHHLDHIVPDWRNEVSDCYFGHTHLPFADHQYAGVMFHNTGSAIRHMGFQPLDFRFG